MVKPSMLATNLKRAPLYRDNADHLAKGDIAIAALAEVEQLITNFQVTNALAVAKEALEKINTVTKVARGGGRMNIPDNLIRDIQSGEYLGPLPPEDDDDFEYCPDSRSHRHSWVKMDSAASACEWCGRVEE